MSLALATIAAAAARDIAAEQAPANATPAAPADPVAQPAGNASPAAPLDPAAAKFPTSAGLLLVTVKGDKVADYEAVIRALQQALATTTNERHRAIGKGWRVFRAPTGPDPKANVVFIHLLDPVAPDIDYRPSLLLDELLSGASAEMLGKYRDAIVGAPSKLGMEEFANMAVPPPAPANASPAAPAPPKKPVR